MNTVVQVVRGTAKSCENPELQEKITTSGKQTCEAYLELCKKIINIAACEDKTQVPIMKQNLNEYSQKVANGVKNLVILAEELKGDDFIDPNDPNNIAEIELRAAAAKIEAAAAKLAQLQPKPRHDKLFDATDLTFDEIILDAARSIAGATTALVKSASVAQRELIHQGRLDLTNNETRYHDGQWTDGLISAAQQVAQATGTLCEAANDTERVITQTKLCIKAKKSSKYESYLFSSTARSAFGPLKLGYLSHFYYIFSLSKETRPKKS